MFSVKLVARPDARMVEVPLEIEAELPREFDGAALLASSGLPRRVRLKATRDALRLSTAYRADQLVGDIVKSALRGNAQDVERVQDAVMKFIRTVRERRQDGATLFVSANGRGKIDVVEQVPSARPPPPPPPSTAPAGQTMRISPADRTTSLERRLAEVEAALGDRIAALEQKLAATEAQLSRMQVASQVAGPGMDRLASRPVPAGSSTRRATAVDAYAEGLRAELAARASSASARARTDVERCDRAAALVADAEMLGVPADGTSQRLREASAQAAARQTALERLAQEIEFYAGADLPVAAQLLKRLEDTSVPDPAPSLEPVAQALVKAAQGSDAEARSGWMRRAAALCAWQLIEPAPGAALDPESHEAVDAGGTSVKMVACPGARRGDGSAIAQARVSTGAAAAQPAAVAASDGSAPAPAAIDAPAPPAPLVEQAAAPSAAPAQSAPAEASPPAAEPPAPFTGPGETPILPDEAAAAAAAAARAVKVAAATDPAEKDEALAVEMALSVLRPMTVDEATGDDPVEEVHPLVDPLPDDSEPDE